MNTQALPSSISLRSGWIFAIAVTVIYSIQPILLKVTLNLGVSADDLLVLRLIMASLIFWTMTNLFGEKTEKLPRAAFFWCLLSAFFFALGMFGYTLSLNYTTASIASMIFSAFPIVTLLILTFLGERFTIRKAVRVAAGLLGVYLIIGPGGEVNLLGVTFALSACVVYASYLIIMQKYLGSYKGKTVMFYIMSFTALFFVLINLIDGINLNSIKPLAWLLIFVQASLFTYIAQLLLFSAVKGIGSAQMSLLFPLELLLTIFWSFILLSDRLSFTQGFGGALIILSLFLAINHKDLIRRRLMRPRV